MRVLTCLGGDLGGLRAEGEPQGGSGGVTGKKEPECTFPGVKVTHARVPNASRVQEAAEEAGAGGPAWRFACLCPSSLPLVHGARGFSLLDTLAWPAVLPARTSAPSSAERAWDALNFGPAGLAEGGM